MTKDTLPTEDNLEVRYFYKVHYSDGHSILMLRYIMQHRKWGQLAQMQVRFYVLLHFL